MKKVFTFDLHTHLFEKKTEPSDFWKRAASVALDGVAVTEHADMDPKDAYLALLEKKPANILLIPGVEANCKQGHVVALGESEEIYEIESLLKKGIDVKELVETVKGEKILLSIAHPWGLSHDSFAYNYDIDKIEALVTKKNVGVEVYNGIIGHFADFIYESGWVKKPANFLDFLNRNRIARTTGLSRVASRMKNKIDSKTLEIAVRCANAIELGEKAKFITAGSDAHSSVRVGTGILKLKSSREQITNENFLSELMKKDNVIWSGPLVKEVAPGMYEKVDEKLIHKKEVIQGISYATKKVLGKKKKSVVGKVKGNGKGKDDKA